MTKIYFMLVLGLFMLTSKAVFAQDSETAECLLEEVYQQFQSDYLNLKYDVWSFEKKEDTKGDWVGKGFLFKNKEQYYTGYLEDEILIDKDASLFINNSRKSIDIFESYQKEMSTQNQQFDIQQFLKKDQKLKIDEPKKGIKRLSIATPEQLIEKTEMWIDIKTKKILKMVYSYQNNERIGMEAEKMTVEFTVFESEEKSFIQIPQSDQYVVKQNDGYKGKGKYATYELLNHQGS